MAIKELTNHINQSNTAKKETLNSLKETKQEINQALNSYFAKKEQQISEYFSNSQIDAFKAEEKLSKIKKGSLKNLIFHFSENKNFINSEKLLK